MGQRGPVFPGASLHQRSTSHDIHDETGSGVADWTVLDRDFFVPVAMATQDATCTIGDVACLCDREL
jgi:hypothetical protein